MGNPPLVSVVIINYNGLQWLPGCLDSLQEQTCDRLEIVVVDNASEDASLTLLREEYPHVLCIPSARNLGYAAAIELSLESLNGMYLLLINNDTRCPPTMIADLLDAAQKNEWIVTAPVEVAFSEQQSTPVRTRIDPLGHPIYQPQTTSAPRQSFYLTGLCLLTPVRFYRETGGFDPDFFMYCEEVDWFWRLNLQGEKYGYADTLIHHLGAGGQSDHLSPAIFRWRNENTLQMLLKNYPVPVLLSIIPIYFLLNLFEIVFFSLCGRWDLCQTYWQGWRFNLRHLARTWKKRSHLKSFTWSDHWRTWKKMYPGIGKLHHLLHRFQTLETHAR